MDLQARGLSASSPLSNEYKTTHLLFVYKLIFNAGLIEWEFPSTAYLLM